MSEPEAVDQLVAHIEGLTSENAAQEIGSLVEYGGRSLLTATVLAHPAHTSVRLLDSMQEALGRVESGRTRSELCKQTGESLIDALGEQDEGLGLHNIVYDRATVVANNAAAFIEEIQDPSEKAFQFKYLSAVMADRIPGHVQSGETEDAISMAAYANLFLSQARTVAKEIEDPSERIHVFTLLAEAGADNFANARDVVDNLEGIRDHRRIRRGLMRYPETLYGDALGAIEEIEPNAQPERRGRIAVSMARSSGVINDRRYGTGTALRLADSAGTEMHKMMTEYEGSKKLTAAQKSFHLSERGAELSKAIAENHKVTEKPQDDAARRRLIDTTLEVFRTSRSYAQSIRSPRSPFRSKLSAAEQPSNIPSNNAVRAASALLEIEPGAAKDLFVVAFDLAVVEDTFRYRSHEASSVLETIAKHAEKQEGVKEAFELFSLAYRLERGRVPQGQRSHRLEVNARVALRFLAGTAPQPGVNIEDIDRNLVAQIIAVASTDTHVSWLSELRSLKDHVREAGLTKAIDSAVDDLVARREEARRPKTDAALLAQRLVRHHVDTPES